MKKILSVFGLFLALTFINANSVNATTQTPEFPACTTQTPPGDHAHYQTGIHQILGGGLEVGSDDVYSLGNDNYLQCFCGTTNNGIQTNWWSIPEMSQDQINHYTSLGWIYQSSGTAWNLAPNAYLGLNTEYSCGEQPTPTPTPTGQPTPTPTPHEDPKDCHANASCAGPKDPPVCTDPLPETPTLLSVTRSGNDSVDLVWTKVNDAQYYLISYGLESGHYIYGVPNVGNVQSFKISGLDLNNKYYFQVMSHRGCVQSLGSNELSYPNAVGGQVLGLATTGADYGVIKLLGIALAGTLLTGLGLKRLLATV